MKKKTPFTQYLILFAILIVILWQLDSRGVISILDKFPIISTYAQNSNQTQSTNSQLPEMPAGIDQYTLIQQYKDLVFENVMPLDLNTFYMRMGRSDLLVESNEFDPDNIEIGTKTSFYTVVGFSETQKIESLVAKVNYIDQELVFWVQNGITVDEQTFKNLTKKIYENGFDAIKEFYPDQLLEEKIHIVFVNFESDNVLGYFDFSSVYGEKLNFGDYIVFVNANMLTISDDLAFSVIMHEVTHLAHAFYDPNEDIWMKEGIAEFTPTNLGLDNTIFKNQYLEDPSRQINFVNDYQDEYDLASSYGGGALLISSLAYKCGDEFIGDIVMNTENGTDNLNTVLSQMCNYDEDVAVDPLANVNLSFLEFAVGLMVDGNLPKFEIQYGNKLHQKYGLANFKQSCDGKDYFYTGKQYGITFIDLECDGTYTLSFNGSQTITEYPIGASQGHFLAIKNASNGIYSAKTKFDLSEVEDVVLQFSEWHDLGNGKNIFYVSVSIDNENWDILSYPEGAIKIEEQNNLLAGYTDSSDIWKTHRIDLSEYAGNEVWVQIDILNYGSYGTPSVLIDNITIDAIGYSENFEENSHQWELSGFTLASAYLPQYYQFAWVPSDLNETNIKLFSTSYSTDNHVEIDLQGSGTLIVTPTTSHTTNGATYMLNLQPGSANE